MTNTLRIRNWDDLYENNRTRALKKLDWVPIPNRMDGLGYARLIDHPRGPAHFGVWIAIVEIASKCDERGTLAKDGVPMDSSALSVMCRMPKKLIDEALERLLAKEIGWLEEIQQEGAGSPSRSGIDPLESGIALNSSRARRREGKEGNGREGNGTEDGAPTPPPSDASDQDSRPVVSVETVKGEDPIQTFERMFVGEWVEDTWRVFGKCVNTPERLSAFMLHMPLWMKTRKYLEGFGHSSVKFLQSGIWLKSPPGALMGDQQARAPTGAGGIVAKLRARELAALEAERNDQTGNATAAAHTPQRVGAPRSG